MTHMTDARVALNNTWQQPLGANYTGTIGADISKESDYLSVGTRTTLARDFNRKNTTLSLGIAPEYDISSPKDGLPVPYATHLAMDSTNGTQDKKWLVSGLAGMTQVISRRTLMQWNYSFTRENGYLNDPYKLLSLVDPTTGDPLGVLNEKRPTRRTEQTFYWLIKHSMADEDVFTLALRYYTDDWGIRSQTLDFNYRWQNNDHRYIEPHVRYYHQSAADFFRAGVLNGRALPEFASADDRLTTFDGIAFGLRFGYTFRNASQLVLRADYYVQNGESFPSSAVGVQKTYNLFPTLRATIFQIEYIFNPGSLFRKKSSR